MSEIRCKMADDVLFELLHMEMTISIFQPDQSENKRSSISKLEQIGFCTGYRLVERLTKDWPRFKDELDTVKFIFGTSVKREITSKLAIKGVYVLQDNRFRFLTQLSQSKQYIEATPKYLAFTCGVVRGALSNLGITSIVTAEVFSSPTYICNGNNKSTTVVLITADRSFRRISYRDEKHLHIFSNDINNTVCKMFLLPASFKFLCWIANVAFKHNQCSSQLHHNQSAVFFCWFWKAKTKCGIGNT
ncbi:trafficking protein particle complex subunit 6b-like isoform X2 [Tachypleus tridentatus]|uniref:trafficking protein particle complex subunit 6b-like isoform X2 n=1 Tax=Tachypleus tridentatus TaxID=6853 RepID=UPI003FD44014